MRTVLRPYQVTEKVINQRDMPSMAGAEELSLSYMKLKKVRPIRFPNSTRFFRDEEHVSVPR